MTWDRDEKRRERRRWDAIPWEQDAQARLLVAAYPDGLSMEAIALVMGLTRERIRQIEAAAIHKARVAAARLGLDIDVALAELLARPTGRLGGRAHPEMHARRMRRESV